VLGFKDFQDPSGVGIRFNTQGCRSVAGGDFTDSKIILEILEISKQFEDGLFCRLEGVGLSLFVIIVCSWYTSPLKSLNNPLLRSASPSESLTVS